MTTDHNQNQQGHPTPAFPSETLYRVLFEEAADSQFITDRQGRLIAVNRRAVELSGYREEELLGMHFTALIPRKDLAREPISMDDFLQGKTVIMQNRLRRKDGSLCWVENRARMLPEGFIIGTNIDITDRKRTEQELSEHRELLNQNRLIIENSPVILFRWRAEEGWPVDLVSDNIHQFGYEADEMLNGSIPFATLIHPDDLERIGREVEHYCALARSIHHNTSIARRKRALQSA